jgi:outer membrane receptor protein involved in Fe transport
MSTFPNRLSCRRSALAGAVCLALAGAVQAQVSTATVKGQISTAGNAQRAGLAVVAVNLANGATYRTQTQSDGSYTLLGLAPGSYELRVSNARTERVMLSVGETATLDLQLGAADQLERVTVLGASQRQGVRDSQVGTTVSLRMIESMPQTTRNFLSSADLAPGVAFSTDAGGNTKIQSGSQNFDHVNVFIDGVGQKNNILRGGLAGQDSSRGNPFPQSAIAEYKVLTQNYKAEFDQVSSAAITAVTKSGTNEFHTEAYVDRTGTNWRAKSIFEKRDEAAGVPLPPSEKYEYGLSAGGPIVKDKVHYFFAYDGKKIDDSRQILPRELDKLPTSGGVMPAVLAIKGSTVDSFTEHLLFGKLDAQLSEEQHLSLSVRLRRESDHLAEERRLSAPGNDKERTNDETRVDLKHEWSRGDWLSEARLGYEDYRWNPHSAAASPLVKYKVSTATPQQLNGSADVVFIGGSPDAQDRRQKGVFFSEDLSYTGFQGHVVKGGFKVKDMKYELGGTSRSVDVIEALIDRTTGLLYFDGTNCLGTNVTNNGANSDQCKIDRALAPANGNFSNKQYGAYLQDDWTLTKRLELNLGVRWDYEDNMLNNSYVTPADRIAALNAVDVPRWNIAPPAGQTYAQSLAKGGININDYISNGSSRKAFKAAFAPRLGFSYDVAGDRNTVVFGGVGRSYDRTMANHALEELQKNQVPNGEIWLIRNDVKLPFADQFTLGLRQALGQWNGEIAYGRVHAKNQFVWFGGNRDANGGYATQPFIDPLWGGPNGYGTLILGDFVGETKTDSIYMKVEKPYTAASGWTATIAYTYSDAKTTNKEWDNGIFDWTYGKPGRGWNTSNLVDKHRIVGAFMTDKLMPWGMTFSAKGTWASGMPRRLLDCRSGCSYAVGDAPSYRQVDIGLGKQIGWGEHRFTVRADVLNLFNARNYSGFDDGIGGKPAPKAPANHYGGDNLNVDKPNTVRGDNRTVRLMLGYKF